MQRNWIGRQEGARVEFEIAGVRRVEAFTTRLDTIYGATFFALAPGHEVTQALVDEDPELAAQVETPRPGRRGRRETQASSRASTRSTR